ncbi:LysR substrate-binding domain-containing protein [Asticcacaulis sp. YBE204]|uniref:LysR substrate-binding domain-containing protein n=1 Tax=Asticcacaulis sp. YBE204 TaxID=1282363 RepID=UPI0004CEAF20|nr:LysR substrate-binding domain-containing protein [Asticcacaulis sp. YBE204]
MKSRSSADTPPPVHALRALEACVRLKSFARAADELGVTASAITQHIRTVEDWVGKPLFLRRGRYVVPTDIADAAMPSLREGFDRLLEGTRLLREADRKSYVVSISAPPSFAAKWLRPRLEAFRTLHPEYEAWLSADLKLVDFSTSEIDICVRYGPGGYPGLTAEQILSESITPVASPAFIARHGPFHRPQDILQARLLHDMGAENDPSSPSWWMWFDSRGFDDLRALDGPRYNDPALVIDEAVAGRGVALAKRAIAESDIAAGRLQPLFNDQTPLSFAYWLVWPRGRTLPAPVKAFIAWIKSEAQRGLFVDGEGI